MIAKRGCNTVMIGSTEEYGIFELTRAVPRK